MAHKHSRQYRANSNTEIRTHLETLRLPNLPASHLYSFTSALSLSFSARARHKLRFRSALPQQTSFYRYF